MRPSGWIAAGVAAWLALASTGCKLIRLLSEPPEDAPLPDEPNPTPRKGDVDLGTTSAPKAAPSAKATRYRFQARPLQPNTYLVGFALAPAERSGVKASLDDYARAVSFRQAGSDSFQWHPPKGCANDMRCVFDALVQRNHDDVAELAELFKARVRAARLSVLQGAELVVAFTQAIPYEVPRESPFGLLPPAMVVSDRRGDCDSKALLTMMLLDALGVDSVMVESDAHKHAMVGTALPVQGTTLEHQGRRYAFTEVTATGWPIGRIKPELLHPNDWRVVPVQLHPPPSPGHKAPPAPKPAAPQPPPKRR